MILIYCLTKPTGRFLNLSLNSEWKVSNWIISQYRQATEVLLIFNSIFYLCQRYTLTASKVLFHHVSCRCITLFIFLDDYFLNVFWRSDNKIGDSFRLTSLMNFLLTVTTVSTVEWWILFFFVLVFFKLSLKDSQKLSSNFLVKTIVEQIELLKVLIKIKSFMLNINIRPVENYILHKNEMSFFRENNYFFFRV